MLCSLLLQTVSRQTLRLPIASQDKGRAEGPLGLPQIGMEAFANNRMVEVARV